MRTTSIKLFSTFLVAWLFIFSNSLAQVQPSSFSVIGEVNLFASPSGNQIGKLMAGKKLTFTFESEIQSDDGKS